MVVSTFLTTVRVPGLSPITRAFIRMGAGRIDVFATINYETSTHIRERGAWALRCKNDKHPFGGLNVVLSGDAWQFGPIGSSGAVFDNPLKLKKYSSLEQMSTMFWTKGIDSFNRF